MKYLILFILLILNCFGTANAVPIKLANYCSIEMSDSFFKESFEKDNAIYLLGNLEEYKTNFKFKLETDELFLKDTIDKILIANSLVKFALSNEETKCLLKIFIYFSIKSLDKNRASINDSELINLYYIQGDSIKKKTILISLITRLENKITTFDDFKVLELFNEDLALNIFNQSAKLQDKYNKTKIEIKNEFLEISTNKSVLNKIMAKDLELQNYNRRFKASQLINGQRSPNDPKYIDSENFIKIVENQEFDIKKISMIMDNYSLLPFLETGLWTEEQKCTLFRKIIKPFNLYKHSSDKVKYIERFYMSKLNCAKNILESEKLYSTNSTKYYQTWCKDEKDQEKCMMYFNPNWLNSIRKCQNNQQCTSGAANDLPFFFYNFKQPTEQLEAIRFYINRLKYFQETMDVIAFPIEAVPVCNFNICQPNLQYCEPKKLFESLMVKYRLKEYDTCKVDDDCELKEFHPKSIESTMYYAINKNFNKFDHQSLIDMFDQTIHDCQRRAEKNPIEMTQIGSFYDKEKMHLSCTKNKCEIFQKNK